MGNHRTYTTVGAGDEYAYEKANKDAGWVGQNPRQRTKSEKKMTIASGGEFLLETQATALFLPQRSISA